MQAQKQIQVERRLSVVFYFLSDVLINAVEMARITKNASAC